MVMAAAKLKTTTREMDNPEQNIGYHIQNNKN